MERIFRNNIFSGSLAGNLRRVAGMAAVALLSVAGGSGAYAETVAQKQAMKMAQQFFNQAYHETTAPVKLVYNGKRLTTERLFTPFYVYNQPRGGFVIISAENKTFPILAYSLQSNFDPEALSESEKGWLKSYAFDIEMIRYDSRVPEEAITAWTNYPEYLAALLDAPESVASPQMSEADAASSLDEILYAEDDSRDGEYSAFYTPAQWQDMIDDQLAREGNVALGYVDTAHRLTPGVVYGKKGDYYRIAFDRRNDWMVRLLPAEYLGERMVALIGEPRYKSPSEEEDPAFAFYDSYADEMRRNAFPSTSGIEDGAMALISDTPIVRNIGGGHFEVMLPENARLAMLYNINGSHIGRNTYDGRSPIAHLNIEGESGGFYFAVIFGESGRPYSVKLYR